jgi:hypothetical protein
MEGEGPSHRSIQKWVEIPLPRETLEAEQKGEMQAAMALQMGVSR